MRTKKVLALVLAALTLLGVAGSALAAPKPVVLGSGINVGGTTITGGSSSGSSSSTQTQTTRTGTIVNCSSWVSMRKSASSSSSRIAKLNKGVSVTILDASGSYYKISYDGKEGYVSSQYVQLSSGSNANTNNNTAATGTGVTTGNINFRTGPSTSHGIIDSYNRGKELTITGSSGDWTACRIDGQNGYVYSQYVTTTKPGSDTTVEEPETTTAYIRGNTVRFRSGPSLSSSILGEYNTGKEISVTGTSGDWTACTIDGQSGYVYSQYVTTTAPAVPGTGGSELGRQIAEYALQFVGYDYVWGGTSPSTGFDCSGLMYYVYSQFGYQLNRVAEDQARNGVHVDPSDLQPGDILCFYSNGYIGHVGMYIGNGQFVHAANSRSGVIITDLTTGYYATRGYEARRIV